tara:strand:+ start:57 stop:557 length:501 start_codon:yes stop_codon:yes gene_type:complete
MADNNIIKELLNLGVSHANLPKNLNEIEGYDNPLLDIFNQSSYATGHDRYMAMKDYIQGYISPSDRDDATSILQGLVANNGHENIDREIMFNSEEDYWKSVANERPDLKEAINNIKRFPKEIVGNEVRYQIPIRHDDGSIDEGWRTMDMALQDYPYIYQRTALSNP